MFKKALLTVALFLFAAAVPAQENGSEAAGKSRWESSHSIEMNGETVEYDAVVASTTLTNDDGEDAGKLFYTAYFRTNGTPSRERPLIFSYNGGPGSASFWLPHGHHGTSAGWSPPRSARRERLPTRWRTTPTPSSTWPTS